MLNIKGIHFKVEDNSWGNAEKLDLEGKIDLGLYMDLGEVSDTSIYVNQNLTIFLNNLPEALQQRYIEIYQDTQKFIHEESKTMFK